MQQFHWSTTEGNFENTFDKVHKKIHRQNFTVSKTIVFKTKYFITHSQSTAKEHIF